eukprot:TRINITY_DN3218_c0_g1_i1.p1 TRINITY_DN3218_c0_g1~~TRINITY_DN3218_c0_g1_i1.p1  ORF type:complete len:256 (+),score=28.91 TRINITY_DN3218_c0_g1_i1:40-807(+)
MLSICRRLAATGACSSNKLRLPVTSTTSSMFPMSTNSESAQEPNKLEHALKYQDFFDVHNLFTVKDLFNARVHLGHKHSALDDRMKQFIYGVRFGQSVIDLDQTTLHLRQALNFLAHMVYRNGIVMFVCRQPQLIHMVDKTALECGEYSYTRPWVTEIFTAPTLAFQQEVRLPDVLVMLHSKDSHQYADHLAIRDAAKIGIPTIGIVDSDCNPNLITYPIPGNDDSLSSASLYLDLFKTTILIAKDQRNKDNLNS